MDYSNSLLNGVTKIILNKLQTVQNILLAACFMTRTSRYIHLTPAFTELHWLTCTIESSTNTDTLYTDVHGPPPEYTQTMLEVNTSSKLKCKSRTLVKTKSRTTTHGIRSIVTVARKPRNSLPIETRNSVRMSS